MATFAKQTFSATSYAAHRPTYPRRLYQFIFRFHAGTSEGSTGHSARWERAVDLGCGTGQATTELTPFHHIIGVDAGKKMVERARDALATVPMTAEQKIEYVQAAAEELGFLGDGTVDLLVAGQACHWFDWKKMWPEAARVLRPGGSLAFWTYSRFRFTHYPSLTPLINAYEALLGPYYQQPGRSILDGHLQAVPSADQAMPGGVWEDWRRVNFTGDYYPELTPTLPIVTRKTKT